VRIGGRWNCLRIVSSTSSVEPLGSTRELLAYCSVCCYMVLLCNPIQKLVLFLFQHETIAGYRAYIHGIVGFFVVEDHVLNTGNGLVNRTYLDEVWSLALSKIVNALRTHSVCTTTSLSCEVLVQKLFFSQ
jgi:hypothetical protein